MKNFTTLKQLPLLNFSNALQKYSNDTHITIYTIDFGSPLYNTNSSLRNLNEQQQEDTFALSNTVEFEIIDDDNNNNMISFETNDTIEISFPAFEGVNKEMFDYYYTKGIDIYNISDPAFIEDCYVNYELDFDLTREYRKKHLYRYYFKPSDNNCVFIGYDETLGYWRFNCSVINNKNIYQTKLSIITDNLIMNNKMSDGYI